MKIINKYYKLERELENVEKRLDRVFRKRIEKDLEKAKTKQDFKLIKDKLRTMPHCVSKIFIFSYLIQLEKDRL